MIMLTMFIRQTLWLFTLSMISFLMVFAYDDVSSDVR